jgi:hypothetical protein
MREHAHLAAMVGFVGEHVAEHLHANRPRPRPAVSDEFDDAAPATVERFREHFRAASGALRQGRARLLRRAPRAVQLLRNLQARSRKPDPLGADIVHVREDRRDGAGLAGRLGCPGARVKMFDEDLVHALIGREGLDCGSAELRVNFVLTGGHGLETPPALGKDYENQVKAVYAARTERARPHILLTPRPHEHSRATPARAPVPID